MFSLPLLTIILLFLLNLPIGSHIYMWLCGHAM